MNAERRRSDEAADTTAGVLGLAARRLTRRSFVGQLERRLGDDPEYLELLAALRVFVNSCEREANLTLLGRLVTRTNITRLVNNRLQIDRNSHAPAEGYTAFATRQGQQNVVLIQGNDSRGVLYGIGFLLRKLSYAKGGPIANIKYSAWQFFSSPDSTITSSVGWKSMRDRELTVSTTIAVL